jgi:hypothetical protein
MRHRANFAGQNAAGPVKKSLSHGGDTRKWRGLPTIGGEF